MKFLLAPSETKISGGEFVFELDKLIFKELTPVREKLINEYQTLLNSNDMQSISKMFGLKKEQDIKKYINVLKKEPALKAIERYTGVAFDYLNYSGLNLSAQEYIDKNVLIFSNLFGVLKASDKIPLYRLKQGEDIASLNVAKVYKEVLKKPLDEYLENEDILDIRAGFYDKFYKPAKNYTTLKFLKNGKVVSHWAKAYRGMVLKEAAINQVKTINQFIALNIKGLEILEIRKSKSRQEIIYEIFKD